MNNILIFAKVLIFIEILEILALIVIVCKNNEKHFERKREFQNHSQIVIDKCDEVKFAIKNKASQDADLIIALKAQNWLLQEQNDMLCNLLGATINESQTGSQPLKDDVAE